MFFVCFCFFLRRKLWGSVTLSSDSPYAGIGFALTLLSHACMLSWAADGVTSRSKERKRGISCDMSSLTVQRGEGDGKRMRRERGEQSRKMTFVTHSQNKISPSFVPLYATPSLYTDTHTHCLYRLLTAKCASLSHTKVYVHIDFLSSCHSCSLSFLLFFPSPEPVARKTWHTCSPRDTN